MKKSKYITIERKDYNFILRLAKVSIRWEQAYYAGNADYMAIVKNNAVKLTYIKRVYKHL